MSDWDTDGDQLRSNLHKALSDARNAAGRRVAPTLAQAREWHDTILQGLVVPGTRFVAKFRGEPGLQGLEVKVGNQRGVASHDVMAALKRFEEKLQNTVSALDALIVPGRDLTADHLAAVIDLCAWAHAEWVRIHPFANGNGRTARLWANCIAMRYGLPPFVRLRPRPDDGYGTACAAAMAGRWQATVPVFRDFYRDAIRL